MSITLAFLVAHLQGSSAPWPVAKLIPGSDIPLAVREFGSGEPVLYLAGGPGLNAIVLRDLISTTSRGRKLIVLDQRGTGDTLLSRLDNQTLSLDRYVDDIEAVRKFYGVRKLHILGHSWGSLLAMLYTSRKPENVASLALLSSPPLEGDFITRYNDNATMRLTREDIRAYENAQRIAGSNPTDASEMYALRAQWPAFFYDRNAAEKSRDLLGPGIVRAGIDSVVLESFYQESEKIKKGLRRFAGPVMLLQGRQDLMGESTPFAIRNSLPQSGIVYIERTGRFPWLESPKATSMFINAWLASPSIQALVDVQKAFNTKKN